MFCMTPINEKKEKKIMKFQNVKCVDYFNSDKKIYYDISYSVELYRSVCQILKVGESI